MIENENQKEQEEVKDMNKVQSDQLIRAYQDVFLSSAEGQLVLWDLLNECYVFRRFGSLSAATYSLEGKREIGLMLLERVQFATKLGGPGPGGFQKILDSLGAANKVQLTNTKKKEDAKDE